MINDNIELTIYNIKENNNKTKIVYKITTVYIILRVENNIVIITVLNLS